MATTDVVVLGVVIWAVFVYSAIAAVNGSPVLKIIRQADETLFEHAARLFDEHGSNALDMADERLGDYLRAFFWRSMVALVAGMTEIAIVLILVLKNRTTLIVWALLIKQMISFPLEHMQRRGQSNQLRVIRNLPTWFVVWTRASYTISALCLLALFVIEMKLLG